MRTHLGSSEKEAEQAFNLKQDRGGIVDIEFLVQFSALAYSATYPNLMEFTDNIRILDAMEVSGVIAPAEAETLREAYKAFRALGHRQTLQDKSNTVSDHDLEDYREAVTGLWEQQVLSQASQDVLNKEAQD